MNPVSQSLRANSLEPTTLSALLIVGLTIIVGCSDYATGPHVSMSSFYLLPLTLAAWSWGRLFALAVALACAAISMAGNIANGDLDYLTPSLALWNGGVQLASYVVVAFTVAGLRQQQSDLEKRVKDRTAAIERLQLDLLQVSEREQRRIGQDLHDGLCQHLAGAAFTCQALQEELASQGLPEARSAQNLVDLIKEGVLLSRQSAMGLDPVEMGADGLMESLGELASTTEALFRIGCSFDCSFPVLISDSAVAAHLFRIAQEAVRNAINHGRARSISIVLTAEGEGHELRIEDDGLGLSNTVPSQKGMGLSIMRNRASIIGAEFEVRDRDGGGTVVYCTVPEAVIARNTKS